MSLKTAIQDAVASVLSAVGDIAVSCTFHSMGTMTYNTTTGAYTEADGTNVTISAILTDFEAQYIDNQIILPTDRQALVAASELSDVSPKPGDYITISTERWNVVSFQLDPADALYSFHIRAMR
jgi:hypothetical protein